MRARHFLVTLLLTGVCAAQAPLNPPADVRPADPPPLVVDPPDPPPPVPPRKDVPLDLDLQKQARRMLLDFTATGSPTLAANALEALQQSPDEEVHRAALAALQSRSPLVRSAGAMAVGEMRLKPAHATLLGMVNDPDTRVQAAVRFALHRLGDTRHTRDLEKLSQHNDPWTRSHTAFVLGRLGEPTGVRVLKHLLEDARPAVRLQAAEAMWRLRDERGLRALVVALSGSYADDQMVALPALAAPGDPAVRQHVRGYLTGEWAEVTLAAARAMGMLGSDEGYGVALKHIRDKDGRRCALAALALGAIGRLDGQEHLAPLLRDERSEVRLATSAALLELGRRAR